MAGNSSPLGYSEKNGVSNFALFSSHATKVFLGLFLRDSLFEEIPLNQTGNIWHIGIENLPPNLTYAYRCEGPETLLYHREKWLMDPYAKHVKNQKAFVATAPSFNWENDRSPQIPLQDLIIYEMHVRGFTKHPSSKVSHPGTYLGIIEKIPYLKKLGINAVELMPIFGFDPTFTKHLVNYWGYNPLHFFAPADWYAYQDPLTEFKTLVRELHKAGIEVILDVVYNHTGEEDLLSYCVNFRGIDQSVYYMLDERGQYLNFSGCGNTFNTNHPAVQKLILDSLRYWVEETHVDGFRFDLASIFNRDPQGYSIDHSPILREMQKDPILSPVKLIAEPWDAGGLYQLGYFAKLGNWSEWNSSYRDEVRRFLKGVPGKAGIFANVFCGSDILYDSPLKSINFITAHDGFTLRDLVTYDQKHNFSNGESNRDGNCHNESWNCGIEGPTEDPFILELRERQMRNFLLTLFLSQGIPMLLMGDEYGHTRKGNNNPYCQDNEINWFLWDRQNPKMFQFISSLIALRKKWPQLRRPIFLQKEEIDWMTDWNSRLVSFVLKPFYIAFNANDQPAHLVLPKGDWRTLINTREDWKFHEEGPIVSELELAGYSSFLAYDFSF